MGNGGEAMEKHARIFIAGSTGLVGRALVRKLTELGYVNLITRNRHGLNLLNHNAVDDFFQRNYIDYVFMAAGRVGGIMANSMRPADFLYENAVMACNVLHSAALCDIKKLLYLGSSCIYPRDAVQPISEKELLNGPLEKTNEAYAIAKIMGLKLCEAYNRQEKKRFISAMPCNLYGPFDHFDLATAHVIPAMMHRFHLAKLSKDPSVRIWGTGRPLREFLYVDDAAEGLIHIMNHYEDPEPINLGSGQEESITSLAVKMKSIVGFGGDLEFDHSKPDGTPRKIMNSSKLGSLGFKPKTKLIEGLKKTYDWAIDNHAI